MGGPLEAWIILLVAVLHSRTYLRRVTGEAVVEMSQTLMSVSASWGSKLDVLLCWGRSERAWSGTS
jgi:hypothetical protein